QVEIEPLRPDRIEGSRGHRNLVFLAVRFRATELRRVGSHSREPDRGSPFLRSALLDDAESRIFCRTTDPQPLCAVLPQEPYEQFVQGFRTTDKHGRTCRRYLVLAAGRGHRSSSEPFLRRLVLSHGFQRILASGRQRGEPNNEGFPPEIALRGAMAYQ